MNKKTILKKVCKGKGGCGKGGPIADTMKGIGKGVAAAAMTPARVVGGAIKGALAGGVAAGAKSMGDIKKASTQAKPMVPITQPGKYPQAKWQDGSNVYSNPAPAKPIKPIYGTPPPRSREIPNQIPTRTSMPMPKMPILMPKRPMPMPKMPMPMPKKPIGKTIDDLKKKLKKNRFARELPPGRNKGV